MAHIRRALAQLNALVFATNQEANPFHVDQGDLTQVFADRVEGKPRQRLELSGPDGSNMLDGLSIQDLDRRIEDLLQRGEYRAAG